MLVGFCVFFFFFFLRGHLVLYPRRTQQWLGLVLRVCVRACLFVFVFKNVFLIPPSSYGFM